MNIEFEAALKNLNKSQLEAANYIEGPLLVIAGPGTGKTQLLSMRAANILDKTDTDPSSILCLTFTNFAANNMRERLFKLIGPAARGIVVKTFHSFAGEIMELYPEYFWNGAELKTAPDAIQLDIVKSILSALPLDNPLALRYNGQLTLVSDVQSALKLTKEAGFTPDELKSIIDSNAKYLDTIEGDLAEIVPKTLSIKTLENWVQQVYSLPDQAEFKHRQILVKPLSEILKLSLASAIEADLQIGKTTNTGKWKRRWLQNIDGHKKILDERKRNSWWLALADVYQSYREQLHGQGYYDYSDMIIEVNNQLESNNELRAMVQERFLYIQVDEFQDTNAAQLKLADLVASHPSDEGRPNLMAVGDDDQSIFAFNGAELNNMLTFQKAYRDVKTLVLTDNYRSTSKVLDAAAGIVNHAQTRVVTKSGLTKDIKAARDSKTGKIAHLKFPTYEHHIYMLADKIYEDFKAGHQVSVLARQHATLKDMASALNQKGAPISYEQQNNSLDQPLVKSLNLVARAVHAISQGDIKNSDYYICQILADPPWQISPDQLWKIAIDLRNKKNWLEYLLSEPGKLKDIALWMQWLAKNSLTQPLGSTLEYISGLVASDYLTSPIRQYYLESDKVTASYLANISALNNLLKATKEFTESKTRQTSLSDYIDFIDLQESLDKPISDTSWFASGNRTIELLTVYKAKGLEYDVVYILDTNDKTWSPRKIGRKPPANLPMQPYGESADDYVRLMYVAATRAKHSIYAASYTHDYKGEEVMSSPLIEHFETTQIQPTELESAKAIESSISWPALETDKQQSLLKKYVEDYQISATSLLDFLDVTSGGPQHFLERHVLRLPESGTDEMAFGTAIHRALQTSQILTNSDSYNLDEILKAYEISLTKQFLPETTHTRLLEHGQKLLKTIVGPKGELHFKSGDLSEYSINNIRLEKAVIGGKIDHLALDESTILISDYKTGGALKSFYTRDKNKAVKAWRHKNQLLFYGLLIKNDPRIKKLPDMTGQMIYVEADTPKDMFLRLPLEEKDLVDLAQLIEIVNKHVKALSFPDTRHYGQDIEGIQKFSSDLLNNKLPLK